MAKLLVALRAALAATTKTATTSLGNEARLPLRRMSRHGSREVAMDAMAMITGAATTVQRHGLKAAVEAIMATVLTVVMVRQVPPLALPLVQLLGNSNPLRHLLVDRLAMGTVTPVIRPLPHLCQVLQALWPLLEWAVRIMEVLVALHLLRRVKDLRLR
jgi:hypothetical protein